jgi:hypothetical protein
LPNPIDRNILHEALMAMTEEEWACFTGCVIQLAFKPRQTRSELTYNILQLSTQTLLKCYFIAKGRWTND